MGRFRVTAKKRANAVIVELFFDGDRNETEPGTARNPLWRILVWRTAVGDKEINPDAPYLDARPGKTYSFTDGHREAKAIARELRGEAIVYFSEVIPASHILDMRGGLNDSGPIEHKFIGETGGAEWEPSHDFNLGQSGNFGEEDTTP